MAAFRVNEVKGKVGLYNDDNSVVVPFAYLGAIDMLGQYSYLKAYVKEVRWSHAVVCFPNKLSVKNTFMWYPIRFLRRSYQDCKHFKNENVNDVRNFHRIVENV